MTLFVKYHEKYVPILHILFLIISKSDIILLCIDRLLHPRLFVMWYREK